MPYRDFVLYLLRLYLREAGFGEVFAIAYRKQTIMMKKILFNTALAVAVALMAAGCKAFRTVGSEHTATGNPYEVIVVCAQPQWQSELGDTLQAVLRQPWPSCPSSNRCST